MQSGDILLEFGSGTECRAKFSDALRNSSTLAKTTTVRCVEPKATVKLRDHDELTTIEEITAWAQSAEAKVLLGGRRWLWLLRLLITMTHCWRNDT